MTGAALGFLKQRLLGSTSFLQALPAKPHRQRTRDAAIRRRRLRANGGLSADPFRVEPLEPRLLLSADLLPVAAQHAILTGLDDFNHAVQNLNSPNTALGAHLPFVNLPAAQIANLAPFVAEIGATANQYFGSVGNGGTPTAQGLAAALQALPGINGNVTLTASGTVDTFGLTIKDNFQLASQVFDLSGAVQGLDLVVSPSQGNADPQLAASSARSLTLSFGIDTDPASQQPFSIGSATLQAGLKEGNSAGDNVTSSFNLQFGPDQTFVTGATADLSATATATLSIPTGSPGITDAQLTSMPVEQLFQTSLTGSANLGMDVHAANLPKTEHITVGWQGSLAPTAATITYPSDSTLKLIVASPLLGEVGAAVGDLQVALTSAERIVDGSQGLDQSLPFVGTALENANVLGAPLAQIGTPQSKLSQDVQSTTTHLSTILSDVSSVYSSAGLLPGTAANDVELYYTLNGDLTAHKFAGEAVTVGAVSSLEIDLTLGKTVQNTVNLDFDLPGLGLSIQPSTITGSYSWTFNVGFGFTKQDAYVALAPGASTLVTNVSYTLPTGFATLGRMGLLQAVVYEPASDQHSGLAGNLFISPNNLNSQNSSQAAALKSGYVESNPAPSFNLALETLNGHSSLQVVFGAHFPSDKGAPLKNDNGGYSDDTGFPTITGHFVLEAPADQSIVPTVGFNNIQLDFGTALSNLVLPILKPFYDETNGLLPFINFMTQPVPVLNDILQIARKMHDSDVDDAVKKLLPSLDLSDPNFVYDWVHLAVDVLVIVAGGDIGNAVTIMRPSAAPATRTSSERMAITSSLAALGPPPSSPARATA